MALKINKPLGQVKLLIGTFSVGADCLWWNLTWWLEEENWSENQILRTILCGFETKLLSRSNQWWLQDPWRWCLLPLASTSDTYEMHGLWLISTFKKLIKIELKSIGIPQVWSWFPRLQKRESSWCHSCLLQWLSLRYKVGYITWLVKMFK